MECSGQRIGSDYNCGILVSWIFDEEIGLFESGNFAHRQLALDEHAGGDVGNCGPVGTLQGGPELQHILRTQGGWGQRYDWSRAMLETALGDVGWETDLRHLVARANAEDLLNEAFREDGLFMKQLHGVTQDDLGVQFLFAIRGDKVVKVKHERRVADSLAFVVEHGLVLAVSASVSRNASRSIGR